MKREKSASLKSLARNPDTKGILTKIDKGMLQYQVKSYVVGDEKTDHFISIQKITDTNAVLSQERL